MDTSRESKNGPALDVAGEPERLETLTRACTDDLLEALGLYRGGMGDPGTVDSRLKRLATRAADPACRIPATRLARQIAFYDDIVGERGLGAGGEWAVERLSRSLSVFGAGHIPETGPLLVVSNHPGLADSLSLFAATPRDDLRVVAAEREFLRALPNTSRYLISLKTGPGGQPASLGSLRRAGRHLRDGGTLLTFPRGGIEPDPASMTGAQASLEGWRHSLELFVRLAPDVTVVPAIVSGVISPTALANPVCKLRSLPEDRRWLAACLQMLVPALRNVHTTVRFGRPIPADTARRASETREEVLEESRRIIGISTAACDQLPQEPGGSESLRP